MTVKSLGAIVGQNHGTRMAPNLTFANDVVNAAKYYFIEAISGAGALTTYLSLTGKWEIYFLYVQGGTTNDLDQIKLTVDGVVIWDEDGMTVNSGSFFLIGAFDGDNGRVGVSCDSSFLLELEWNTDADVDFFWYGVPIL